MTTYVALLRAVNVGGTGKLPMSKLKAMCEAIGCAKVRTYIASGNVVFESKLSEGSVKVKLEAAISEHAGKPMGVIVRTGAEMAEVVANNPFPKASPSQAVAIFLDEKPKRAMLDGITGAKREDARLGAREIYVHYPDGIGRSKLKIPGAASGTMRNMNTVAKLAQMAGERE